MLHLLTLSVPPRRSSDLVDAAGRKAARRLDATYVQPWLAHATAEPMNCLVRLDKDRASLVVPTQAPQKAWAVVQRLRSEEHTSELQSLMRISYAVFCLKKKSQVQMYSSVIQPDHL